MWLGDVKDPSAPSKDFLRVSSKNEPYNQTHRSAECEGSTLQPPAAVAHGCALQCRVTPTPTADGS